MKRFAALGGIIGFAAALTAGAAFADSSSRPFTSAGSGTETSLGTSSCQFSLAGCIVESKGTAVSSHLGKGTYTNDLTVVWAQPTSNGSGGFCAPATGTSTLTAANGDTLTLSETGKVCEVGATATNAPHTFVGTYTITGGTGRFTGASGSGTVNGSDNGYGASQYQLAGTLVY